MHVSIQVCAYECVSVYKCVCNVNDVDDACRVCTCTCDISLKMHCKTHILQTLHKFELLSLKFKLYNLKNFECSHGDYKTAVCN